MAIHPTALVGEPPEDRSMLGQPGIPPEIHPEAILEAFVTVDAGTERPTRVGARTYMLKKSHAGHDSQIGDDCDLATGCIIGGHAEIGDGVKVGLNAVVLPYRKVGAGARIGAGAVVTKDIPAGETWKGNPARKLEQHERDPRPHTERRTATVTPVDHDAGRDVWEALTAAVNGGIGGRVGLGFIPPDHGPIRY